MLRIYAQNPSVDVEKHAKHAVMHLLANPIGVLFGSHGKYDLIVRKPTVRPFSFTSGAREMGLHVFADGSLGERKSMSGAIQMLAAGPVGMSSWLDSTSTAPILIPRRWYGCV